MAEERMTPYRVALCLLLQLYAAGAPTAPLSRGARQRLALFLLQEAKASDDFLEPSLAELQERVAAAVRDDTGLLARQLAARVRSFTCPDDLITLFTLLRGLLATGPYIAPMEGGQEAEARRVEAGSALGLFLRRSLLSFESLSFEATCHLLTGLQAYSESSDAAGSTEVKAEVSGAEALPGQVDQLWEVRGGGGARGGSGRAEEKEVEQDTMTSGREDFQLREAASPDMWRGFDGLGDGPTPTPPPRVTRGHAWHSVRPDSSAGSEEMLTSVEHRRSGDTPDGQRSSSASSDRMQTNSGSYGQTPSGGSRSIRMRDGGFGTSPEMTPGSGRRPARRQAAPTGRHLSFGYLDEHVQMDVSNDEGEGGDAEQEDGRQALPDAGFSLAFGADSSIRRAGAKKAYARSRRQVEAYLTEQASALEKQVGTLPPGILDAKLDELAKYAPDVPRVHHLRYLNALHHGDYPAAMDSLHRYFDYSAGQEAAGGDSESNMGWLQTGLLTLGSMHARFGHFSQALQALNETIRIAQQNNDVTCLSHALAAFCHVAASDPPAVAPTLEQEPGGIASTIASKEQLLSLLRQCLRVAADLKLPYLAGLSCMALAKFLLDNLQRPSTPGGLKLADDLPSSPIHFHQFVQAAIAHLDAAAAAPRPVAPAGGASASQASLRASGGASGTGQNTVSTSGSTFSQRMGRGGAPGAPRQAPLPHAVSRLAGSARLLRASGWELHGSAPMARITTLLHATCHRESASADDMCTSYAKLASHAAAHQGYEAGWATLNVAAKKYPLAANRKLREVQLALIHDHALNRGELHLAQAACRELSALASPVPGQDLALKIDIGIRLAHTLVASRDIPQALEEAKRLFAACYRHGLLLEHARLLLLFADVHRKAGSAAEGLPYALSCITICKQASFGLLRAAATITLAELLLASSRRRAARALSLLYQELPQILGHGGLLLCGRAHLVTAQCRLSCLEADEEERGEGAKGTLQGRAETVLGPLENAADCFQKLQAWELAADAFHTRAMVLNTIGRHEERNKAAEAFLRCVTLLEEAQTKSDATLPPVG
eukprot:jgi/Mesen1/7555/ME000392S06815